MIAISGLPPLTKVWVDYLPKKNIFQIKINDADFYSLVKEEVEFDPTKTETLTVNVNINEKKNSENELDLTISGSMPWIFNDIEDKIQTALGVDELKSVIISKLNCVSWVANEFLEVLCCNDLPEQGLEKLILNEFSRECDTFKEDVVTRIASICPHLSHLEMSLMHELSEAGRMSIVSLLRQII